MWEKQPMLLKNGQASLDSWCEEYRNM